MNNKTLFITLGAVVLLVAGVAVANDKKNGGGSASDIYTEFAQCITDSGAIFYGASWCGHCQDQKRAFGGAVKLIPYVECAIPNSKAQTEVCTEAGITSYPTWVFADGSQRSGNVPLPDLAEATGCELPVSDE